MKKYIIVLYSLCFVPSIVQGMEKEHEVSKKPISAKAPHQKPDASQWLPPTKSELENSLLKTEASFSPDNAISKIMDTADHYEAFFTLSKDTDKYVEYFAYRGFMDAWNVIKADKGLCIETYPGTCTWGGTLPKLRDPSDREDVYHDYSNSKVQHELKKLNVIKLEVDASDWGICTDTIYKFRNEVQSQQQKEKVHLLAKYCIRKTRVVIEKDSIKISEKFREAIEYAVNEIKNDLDNILSYRNLINVFNNYGFYVSTDFILGAQYIYEDIKEVENISDAEAASNSLASSLGAEVSKAGAGLASTASYTNKHLDIQQNIFKSSKGGKSGVINDLGQWITSTHPYMNWTIITRNYIPVIDVLDNELKDKCIRLIKKHYKTEASKWTLAGMQKALNDKVGISLVDQYIRLSKILPKEPTFKQVYSAFEKLRAYYDDLRSKLIYIEKVEYKAKMAKEMQEMQKTMESYSFPKRDQTINSDFFATSTNQQLLERLKIITADVLIIMEMYEKLMGEAHTIWDDFQAIRYKEDTWKLIQESMHSKK